MLSGLDLLIGLTIILVGATVMGTLGFGLGLVTVPVLMVVVDPQSVVVIVNGSIAVLMLLVLLQARHHLDLRLAGGMALGGGVAATPIGVLALDAASPTSLRLTIALVILVLAVLSLFRVPLPFAHKRLAGPVLGFLTSLSVTTLGIGGPLVAIYAVTRGWAPPVIRASLACSSSSSKVPHCCCTRCPGWWTGRMPATSPFYCPLFW